MPEQVLRFFLLKLYKQMADAVRMISAQALFMLSTARQRAVVAEPTALRVGYSSLGPAPLGFSRLWQNQPLRGWATQPCAIRLKRVIHTRLQPGG